ncbi:MAG TPA: RNA methyltransferase [Solirubrobacterales bacterium]|nr:RNA methyltransferase [Solirubrobacterales bacterium]
MITSPHNEKLKLIRRLRERRHREREGLFVAEGEDLVDAAAAAGVEPELVLRAGKDVDPGLLDEVSALGSGTRVIGVYRRRLSEPRGPVCVYLHAVGDPGNVGTVIRTAHALVEGSVVLGPACADPFGPKAVRATMGSVFAQPVAAAELDATPAPRVALTAHGGKPAVMIEPPVTIVLGAEREGLPPQALALCDEEVTIALRPDGAESLNVAAAAAIVLHGISSARRKGDA